MPNLEFARRRMERLMTDKCIIHEKPLRLADAPVDPVTLEIDESAVGSLVYSGKCLVSRESRVGSERPVEGEYRSSLAYKLAIPWAAKVINKGHLVTMTRAADKGLAGKVFTITDTKLGTMTVSRRATMELVETDRD